MAAADRDVRPAQVPAIVTRGVPSCSRRRPRNPDADHYGQPRDDADDQDGHRCMPHIIPARVADGKLPPPKTKRMLSIWHSMKDCELRWRGDAQFHVDGPRQAPQIG